MEKNSETSRCSVQTTQKTEPERGSGGTPGMGIGTGHDEDEKSKQIKTCQNKQMQYLV
jgi:hypothetical protein